MVWDLAGRADDYLFVRFDGEAAVWASFAHELCISRLRPAAARHGPLPGTEVGIEVLPWCL